jgi:hypothetical protein
MLVTRISFSRLNHKLADNGTTPMCEWIETGNPAQYHTNKSLQWTPKEHRIIPGHFQALKKVYQT